METQDRNTANPAEASRPANRGSSDNRGGRAFAGLVVVAIGSLLLARELGADIPRGIVWPSIFLGIGLFIGVRHSFRGFVWAIFMMIGGAMMLDRFYPWADISDFIWPVAIITVGLLIMMKSFGKKNDEKTRIWSDRSEQTPDDYLDSTTAFGGVKRNIISKNFKGGEITTIFGGTDLIFTQADVNGKIVLEVTQLFGGTKLIVPPHWKVETGDLVCVFGGVDDKRPAVADGTVDQNKVLVLKGTCIFGGIDIKSY